jgi:plastocyanin
MALVVGGFVALTDPVGAATAVTISGAGGCSGTTFCYVPASATVASGDTVTWTNQSGAPHTVTRCDAANCSGTDGGTGTDPSFDMSVASANGTAVNHTFTAAGTYNYYCKIHGFSVMHGTVTVQGQTAPTTTAPAATTTTTRATTAPPAAAPAAAVAGQVNFTG